MRQNWFLLMFAAFAVVTQFEVNAQQIKSHRNMSFDKRLDYVDGLFKDNSYFEAIDYYQQMKRDDERNVYYTYQLAECYRYTRDYVPAAHYYAEAYTYSKRVYPFASYYAGLMFKQQGEYQQAIVMFNQFLNDNKKIAAQKPGGDDIANTKYTPKEMKQMKKFAKLEIDGCNMAIKSIKDPQPVTIVNCGPNVNTFLTELSPYPLGDSDLLYSTVGRDAGFEQVKGQEHFEKFVHSHKQPGYVDSFQWPMPFNDGGFNDRNYHTANGCISPDGSKFYFSKCRPQMFGDTEKVQCAIYVSTFKTKGWGAPEEVSGGINEPGSSNTMPFVAKVGKKDVLFFTSNRKLQSRGGWDIWYSIIDPRNGTYRRPANCGKTINTPLDEITPYYDPREGKLYFASTGRISFGGSDIYEATGGPSRYKNVRNMGFPINSPADDLYYIKDPVGKPDAYVVSNRIGSYSLKNPTCCNDIFRIQSEPQLSVIGKVIDRRTQQNITQSAVKMIDQKGELKTYNSEDGNFIFNMERSHSYVITADKMGYTTSHNAVSTMDVKRTDPDDTVYITVVLDSIKNDFKITNIWYDYNESTIKSESVGALDSLVTFMKDNASISVEIYSFTDNIGTVQYNKALSQRRAQAVVDYLEKNGIDRSRLKAVGFGASNPVAPEMDENGKDNVAGRAKNRRTEFRIIGDQPTRRVLYNSALKGSMNQQMENLKADLPDDEDPASKVPNKPVDDDDK
jgi:outer membrane protein OmpA-like peptidoglycan-associated protein